MRKTLVILLGVCFLATFIGSVSARDAKKENLRLFRSEGIPEQVDPGAQVHMTAQVDTYCLAWYDFETMDWQGWTRLDPNSQRDTFTHIDDFAGLGGGDYGGLVPLEGTKSMWCGVRADVSDPYVCGWWYPPGYGNVWNQWLQSEAFFFTGLLTFSYHGYFDSEPDYDFTYVEYDAGEDNWVRVRTWDDVVDTVDVVELLLTQASTKIRFHFISDGAWADEDGLWSTDGAFIVDSLTIADVGGTIDYENFEAGELFAKSEGIWQADHEEGFGLYSGLVNNLLVDKDPCNDNFSTQVVFFIGSPFPSSGYPGLFDVPFCKGPGGLESPCISEEIISPILDLSRYSSNCDAVQDSLIPEAILPYLGGAVLRRTIYDDLPLENLVFSMWGVREVDEFGCPQAWKDRNYVYYGPDPYYIQEEFRIGDLITGNRIQIEMVAIDYCYAWYLINGNCAEHTPAPWFDNIRFYRYADAGPQWNYRDLDLFQDAFPVDEFDMESVIPADAADNLYPYGDPRIQRGDSATVTCGSGVAGGLAMESNGYPAIFCHVRATYLGDMATDPKTPPSGAILEGDGGGRYYGMEGDWTVLQMDSALTAAGSWRPDAYSVDMNDSVFTRGFQVDYYFKARDLDGFWTTEPATAEVYGDYKEFTCLPTLNSDILYVDDYHGDRKSVV